MTTYVINEHLFPLLPPTRLHGLRKKSFITRQGISMLGISDAAESIGFHTQGVKITFAQLVEEKPFPTGCNDIKVGDIIESYEEIDFCVLI